MKRTGSMGSRVPPAVTSTLHAGQVVRQRVAAVEQQLGERGDLLGLGQPACAACRRRSAVPTPAPARRRRGGAGWRRSSTVAGWNHISVCIAGREQHRTSRGQQRGGQQIVGAPVRRPGPAGRPWRARRRRGRPPGRSGRAAPRATSAKTPVCTGLAGQCLERGGADELQRGFGGDDPDGVAGFGELTDDRARLVGGDATGDADDDPLALGHVCSSPERLIARPGPATRPRCARAGRRGSRASRSTAASPAGRARPAGRRTRGCRRRAGCSSR